MRRVFQAAFYSALVTIYGGSLYYAFAIFTAIATNGDVVKAFVDTVLGCLIVWVFGTFAFYELNKAFEEMNRAGRKRLDDRDPPNDSND